jgi:ADP-ribose pyrophosphatase YjhB (NUDIX family)
MKLEVGLKALITNDKGQYLFMQYPDPLQRDNTPRWDIPGGRLKADETLVDSLARELKSALSLKMLSCAVLSAQDIMIDNLDLHIVRITYQVQASGDLRMGAAQGLFRWETPDEALKLHIDSYLRHTLEMLRANGPNT